MNQRKILFSGITVALLGAALGLVLSTLFDPPYTSKHYRHIRRIYVIAGGAGGFLYGASVSAVQQLKELQEARDKRIKSARQPQDQPQDLESPIDPASSADT